MEVVLCQVQTEGIWQRAGITGEIGGGALLPSHPELIISSCHEVNLSFCNLIP